MLRRVTSKRMMTRAASLLILAALLGTACGGGGDRDSGRRVVIVTEKDDGRTITLHDSDILKVSLGSGAWRLGRYPSSLLTPMGSGEDRATYSFDVHGSGTGTLEAAGCGRPMVGRGASIGCPIGGAGGEGSRPPRTFEVTIRVID